MNPKYVSFFCYAWFVSTLICLAIEGTYYGATQNSIIHELSIIQAIKAGGIFAVGTATVDFFHGLMRILLWDYSFYSGGYVILRYFWLVVLSPGPVWGIFQAMSAVFSNFLPRIGI